MKKCPFCAEEIQDEAVVCRYCGRDLNPAPGAGAQESVLAVIHPSLWTVSREIAAIVLVIAAAILLYQFTPYSLYLLVLAPVIAVYVWTMRLRHTYTVTSRRVSSREGLIAKNTSEVDIKDLRSVTVNQGALQRIINIGDILIATAGTDGVEIKFIGIPAPHKVKDMILEQKQ